MHTSGQRPPISGAAGLVCDATLRTTALGLVIFALIVALVYALARPAAGPALAFPAGFGAGAWLARRLSGDRIELGLTPLGAFGTGAGVLALAATIGGAPWAFAIAFGFTGLFAAFFALPLVALLWQRPGENDRRAVLVSGVALMAAGGVAGLAGALWLTGAGLTTPAALRLAAALTTAGASSIST